MSTTRLSRRRAPATPTVRRLGTGEPTEARPAATGAAREPLAPPWASTARCAGGRPWWLPRVTRGRALAVLVVSLVVVMGGALAVSAAAAPGIGGAAAQPAPAPSMPLPTVEPCTPDSPLPICHLPAPATTPPTAGVPLPIPTGPTTPVTCFPGSLHYECLNPPTTASPTSPPCTGMGCIPQPTTSAPAPTNPGTSQSGDSGNGDADCGWSPGSWDGCVTNAINAFFRGVVTAALNPLLDLLSKTLLTTPTPDSLPRIGELWTNSWQILLASYAMLILIAGVLVMSYETLQTRHSVKEIAPRIVVGFLAGALSLWVATQGIEIANGLTQAVMGGGLDARSAGEALKNLVLGSLNVDGIFLIFIGLFLAGMLVALLITYIVRVALTVILIAGAPIALMCHALPQTEGIAFWWWKAFGGCLAIQVVQSLTLITAMKVFLAPGGFTLFGPTASGLVNLLVALALIYILFKIPFWVLGSLRGGGRSLLGTIVRGFIAYKTFGLLRGRGGSGDGGGGGGGGGRPRPSGGGGGGHGGGGRGPTDPYPRNRTTADGQYELPLPGARRTRPGRKSRPNSRRQASRSAGLSAGPAPRDDWPENKPVLGRDGQYRLPLNAQRVTPPTPPASPDRQGSGGRRRGGQQLTLPLDPYQGNRATRSGQYPLPLEGLRRVRTATPAPATLPARPASRAGRQLRLPVDLPRPPRRTPPPQ